MIRKFISLEWKQFTRSSYWQKSLVLNIVLLLFALYLILTFLGLGFFAYTLLKKEFPDKDPLKLLNGFLLYWFLFDLVFRYFMQKIPALNSKPLLNTPLKKKTLTHYILGKSAFSFFNVLPMMFAIPFGIMLLANGYTFPVVACWMLTILCVTLTLNYVNFLLNKNNTIFIIIASLLVILVSLDYYNVLNFTLISENIFNTITFSPYLVIAPVTLLIITYYLNFKDLKSKLFIDGAIATKSKDVKTADLDWTNRFGEMATFLKNDIRLIWRNKRPRTVFFISFVFILYGLIFFTNDIYRNMETMLVFVSIFITGIFTINFGQFIPAWDSSYYSMLMSQNIKYRKYLESKWFLMTVMTVALFLLSIPYIYFGTKIFLLIVVGAIFNIGCNNLVILYAGAFNRKRIELDKSAFANYQGTSANQFLLMIPVLLIPMIIFFIFNWFVHFNMGVIALGTLGILGIIFRKKAMDRIEKIYLKNKYKAVNAFQQKA